MQKKQKSNNENCDTSSSDFSETEVLDDSTKTHSPKYTIIIKDNTIVDSNFNSNMTIKNIVIQDSEKIPFREKFEKFVEKFRIEIGHEISSDFKNFLIGRINFEVRDPDHLVRSFRKLHNYCENNLSHPSLSFITFNDLDFVEELVKFFK